MITLPNNTITKQKCTLQYNGGNKGVYRFTKRQTSKLKNDYKQLTNFLKGKWSWQPKLNNQCTFTCLH